jgi:hypothetical protein
VEERDRARRLTQRSLDPDSGARPEPVPPPPLDAVPQEVPEPARPAPPRIVLDGPSDRELRKRQEAWYAERERFEAYRRKAPPPEGSK